MKKTLKAEKVNFGKGYKHKCKDGACWNRGDNVNCEHKPKLNKYAVVFTQTEHFSVNVEAKNKKQADELACEMFTNGEYDEVGDCEIDGVEVFLIK